MTRAQSWKRIKSWPAWALLAMVVIALLAIGATRDSGPRSTDERVESISQRLACPECEGESVFESRSRISIAIRAEVRDQVTTGLRSDDEIITYVAQRFPESRILLVPRATGIDALVWALPVAAFVCAVAGLAFAFRRWKGAADTVPTESDRELVDAALRSGLDEP